MQMLPNPNAGSNNNNLLVLIIVAIVVFMGFELFGPTPSSPSEAAQAEVVETVAAQQAVDGNDNTFLAETAVAPVELPVAAPVTLRSDVVEMTINPKGSVLSYYALPTYHADVEDDAPLELIGTHVDDAKQVDFGWKGAGINVPHASSAWQIKEQSATRLVLEWPNNSGQVFTRIITLTPGSFTVNITDMVKNASAGAVGIGHYVQVHTPEVKTGGGFMGLPFGGGAQYNPAARFLTMAGVVEGELLTKSFGKVKKHSYSETGKGGWWGINSQYFISAIVPPVDIETQRKFSYRVAQGQGFFTASTQTPQEIIPAGGVQTRTYDMYLGPKDTSALKAAGHGLDKAVDFGFFHLLAKPMFSAMLWIHGFVGNWGLSIILLTLAIKIITFPLVNASYKSMAKLKKLQPEMERLKEKYGEDAKDKMAMEMMGLYKKHGVNPLSGCLPMLIQFPIFIALYRVLFVSFELRHADFGLWIHDLSSPDPLYILPVFMTIAMWMQMRLTPQSPDKMQKQVMNIMMIFFGVISIFFPAGLVIYWLTNTVFSIAQQAYIYRQEGLKA